MKATCNVELITTFFSKTEVNQSMGVTGYPKNILQKKNKHDNVFILLSIDI